MNSAEIVTCDKHGIALLRPFSSGAGFCPRCHLWVQCAEKPMPPLDPWVVAKRAAALKAKRKAKAKRKPSGTTRQRKAVAA